MKSIALVIIVAAGIAHAQVVDFSRFAPKVIGNGAPLEPVPMAVPINAPPPTTPPPVVGPRSIPASGRFLNFSMRGSVGSGGQNLIVGFVVGEGDRILILRAVGPTLAVFGITDFCRQPLLEVFDTNGARVATARPWSSNDTAVQEYLKNAASAVGAFALQDNSADQVLLLFLPRGSYTCAVSGIGGSIGSILLEAYDVPPLVPGQKG